MNMQKKTSADTSTKQIPKSGKVVAALDIGTSKVCVVIARLQPKTESKNFEIIGVSSVPCTGMKKGSVVNIETTVEAIKKAREEAELMAGIKINSCWAGVSGTHVQSFNSTGMVAIKDHEVSAEDIQRVIEAAQAVAIKDDRELLHILTQNYIIDSQEGIRDPLGMSGVRLEVGVHLVTGSVMSMVNITKCAERAGLKISGKILEPLAAAEAVLSQDEKDLGVAVVDLGAGSTDIVIYVNGSVRHTTRVPIGGSHLTQDVSIGLRTPAAQAEEIKKKHGCAMASLMNGAELIEVPSVGGRNARTLSRTTLAEVIEPRAEEMLHLIHNELLKSGYYELLGAGVVMTGGGSCLEGFTELAEFIFEMPVRRGIALNTSGLKEVVSSPIFATAIGLIKFAGESGLSSEKHESFMSKIKQDLTSLFKGESNV